MVFTRKPETTDCLRDEQKTDFSKAKPSFTSGMTTNETTIKLITKFTNITQRRKVKYEETTDPK